MMRFDYRHFEEVDSTNSEAVRQINLGAVSGPVIFHADWQSRGRGSRGRQWISCTGNFFASYIVPAAPNWPSIQLAIYPVALAIRDILTSKIGPEYRVELKWPNDLLVEGRKIAGTLHEVTAKDGQNYLISGIGINIAGSPEDQTGLNSTALSHFTTSSIDPAIFACELGRRISLRLDEWAAVDFSDYREQILQSSYRYRQEVVLSVPAGGKTGPGAANRMRICKGIFSGIGDSGGLLLASGGAMEEILVGEIFPGMSAD